MAGRKATKEEIERRALAFINKAKVIHGDKYDYSLIDYVNSDTKVKILCKEHGIFEQSPYNHYNHGCPECGKISISGKLALGRESFVAKSKEIHGYKYDYSKVEYVNNHIKVKIVCPEHGEFLQRPQHHIKGQGCPSCGNAERQLKRTFTKEMFELAANSIHGQYDYSKFIYINTDTKGIIICPEHGEFLQDPYHHIKRQQGCPKCKLTSYMEKKFCEELDKMGILYVREKTFEELKGKDHKLLRYDFYLPEHNLLIEFDGRQHYDNSSRFYYDELQENDKKKDSFAVYARIKLQRIRRPDFDEWLNNFRREII